MKNLGYRQAIALIATLAVLLLSGVPIRADEIDVVNKTPHPIRKLGRGLANTVGGVLELPLTMREVGLEKGPVAAVTLGALLGCGAAIARTVVGVVDLITFPLPLGLNGYEPLLQPEFILQPGSWTPSPSTTTGK